MSRVQSPKAPTQAHTAPDAVAAIVERWEEHRRENPFEPHIEVFDRFLKSWLPPVPEEIVAVTRWSLYAAFSLCSLHPNPNPKVNKHTIDNLAIVESVGRPIVEAMRGKLSAVRAGAPFHWPETCWQNAHETALNLAKSSVERLQQGDRENVGLDYGSFSKLVSEIIWEAGQLARLERNGQCIAAASQRRMSVDEAQQRLERLRLSGEPFTSQHTLADQIGCSSGTINKAIKRKPELNSWAKRPVAAPKAQSLNEAVTDCTAQGAEPDPEDEAAIREFIEKADPETKAWFLALSRDGQLDFLNDPDASKPGSTTPTLHQKILGRKP
jgi:hypothetical protein